MNTASRKNVRFYILERISAYDCVAKMSAIHTFYRVGVGSVISKVLKHFENIGGAFRYHFLQADDSGTRLFYQFNNSIQISIEPNVPGESFYFHSGDSIKEKSRTRGPATFVGELKQFVLEEKVAASAH